MPYEILVWMAGLGALGGLVNCLMSGEIKLTFYNKETKSFSPGPLGNIVAGTVAAVVIGSIYGPISSLDLTGPSNAHITLGQLVSSLVVGFSGGKILSLEAQKITLTNEKSAEQDAKIDMAEIVETLYNRLNPTENSSNTEEDEIDG
jgi:hypothetical protein